MKKTILLTGGNGFIGKNIQESTLAQKYNITAPRSFELNLIDTESTDNFFADKGFDCVIHAAVKPGHRNAKDKNDLFYSNLRMFENLQRHDNKYNRFINISSGAVYDTTTNITDAKESDIYKNVPADEHGFCKYIEHKLIQNLDKFVDLHIFGVFGKYEDYAIRFISNAICKSIFGLPITLRQNRKFSYLDVDDLIPILEYFIENDTVYKSYNVVPTRKTELLELAQMIKEISGSKPDIIVSKEGYGLDYTGNNKRLTDEIKGLSFTKLETSVQKLYNYYLNNKNSIDIELLKTDK